MNQKAELPAIEQTGQVAITPMHMLQMAVSQNADLDKLEKLMGLHERWEANEARKAFAESLTAFKASPLTVGKDKHVKFGQTEYDHASLGNVCNVIGSELSKYGLSYRWSTEQAEGKIKVTCVLMHIKGHSESVSLESGADTSGGKNSIQGIGSTVSYLQRYTLLAITGTATQDQDDDGKGGESSLLPDDQFKEFEKRIKAAVSHEKARAVYQEAAKACAAIKDIASANMLKEITVKHREFIDQANTVS